MSKPTNTISSSVPHFLPTSLSQVGVVTRFEILNFFRSRRFFVLLGISFAIGGILTGVIAYYGVSTFATSPLSFYSFWWGASVQFIIAINGIFFGGDAISGEFQNKTGYFLVANPLRRSSIYIGKWLGALTASLMIFAGYATITIGNGIYYFGTNIPYQFGESLIFSVIYLVAVLGCTFFFSSLFKSSSMSILVTAILFLFAFGIIQNLVTMFAKIEPWFIIFPYGASIIGNVLTNPYPTHTSDPVSGAPTVYAATISEVLAILLGYFIVTAILGLLMFEKKEFT